MEKMSVRKLSAFFAVMVALILVCAIGILHGRPTAYSTMPDDIRDLAVIPESGFYNTDLQVQLKAPKGAEVYYTLDCTEPDRENGISGSGPVLLAAGEAEQIYVLRAKAFYADGRESEVCTRTYFCGKNIQERYDMAVLSMVGEPEDLFGYEDGILVPGRRYDEYVKENPGAHPGGGVEANYTMRGQESERTVFLEIFDELGQCVISQTGGVRIQGGAARLNNNKSMRLYARSEYDAVKNDFDYDFFADLNSDQDGTLGQTYKRLVVQNSGQDYGYGFVRTQLVGKLAAQAGFPDTQHVRPVCVYINGEYFGIYWLTNDFDREYFEDRYGEYDGQFVVLEGQDKKKDTSDEDDAFVRKMAKQYNAQYKEFSAMDLTDEENFRELQSFMDVENYLQYFAIENYVGNFDWPDGNVRTYRYEAGASGYGEGVYDGRYRMILFDADYGFGLLFYHETIGSLVNEMTLDKLYEGGSPLFVALMERQDCREYFVSYTLDLMNGVMKEEHVAAQVDALHASRVAELSEMLAVEGLVGGLLLEDEPVSMDTVEWNIQRIKAYAAERPEYVLADIEDKFDYDQTYQLTAGTDSERSTVKVNGVTGRAIRGTYLKEVPVTVTAVPGPNERFDHWVVNGVTRSEETLILGGDAVSGDEIDIFLVMHETENPGLHINKISAKGSEDYVELINMSSQPLSTGGYYLSDSEELYQYAVPVCTLAPGETMVMVGESNNSPGSLGRFVLNFDLKQGEVLTLMYLKEEMDRVVIPDLSQDGIYVKDFQKGIFTEQKRESVR